MTEHVSEKELLRNYIDPMLSAGIGVEEQSVCRDGWCGHPTAFLPPTLVLNVASAQAFDALLVHDAKRALRKTFPEKIDASFFRCFPLDYDTDDGLTLNTLPLFYAQAREYMTCIRDSVIDAQRRLGAVDFDAARQVLDTKTGLFIAPDTIGRPDKDESLSFAIANSLLWHPAYTAMNHINRLFSAARINLSMRLRQTWDQDYLLTLSLYPAKCEETTAALEALPTPIECGAIVQKAERITQERHKEFLERRDRYLTNRKPSSRGLFGRKISLGSLLRLFR